jgi:hypothetical protein
MNAQADVRHPHDAEFVDDTYRGVTVPKVWIMTSKCSGKGCISKLAADPNRTLLENVMAYQNPDVEARICRDLRCNPEVAHGVFEDLKKFLWLAGAAPTHDMVPTPIIDEGWHCFLLFTQDYADFCQRFFGTFIHHTAHRVGELRSQRVELIPSIDAMHQFFGGIPSSNWHYAPVEDLAKMAA